MDKPNHQRKKKPNQNVRPQSQSSYQNSNNQRRSNHYEDEEQKRDHFSQQNWNTGVSQYQNYPQDYYGYQQQESQNQFSNQFQSRENNSYQPMPRYQQNSQWSTQIDQQNSNQSSWDFMNGHFNPFQPNDQQPVQQNMQTNNMVWPSRPSYQQQPLDQQNKNQFLQGERVYQQQKPQAQSDVFSLIQQQLQKSQQLPPDSQQLQFQQAIPFSQHQQMPRNTKKFNKDSRGQPQNQFLMPQDSFNNKQQENLFNSQQISHGSYQKNQFLQGYSQNQQIQLPQDVRSNQNQILPRDQQIYQSLPPGIRGQNQEEQSQEEEQIITIHPQISYKEIDEGLFTNQYLNQNHQLFFQNESDYYQSQFYQLREDFTRNLRKELHEIFSHEEISTMDFSLSAKKEMHFYYDIQVINIDFSRRGMVIELQGYPLFLSRTQTFTDSKRLSTGQLIILSNKNGNKCILGYVVYVDTQADTTFASNHSVKFGIKPYLKDSNISEFMGYLLEMSRDSQKEGFFGFEPKIFWQSYCYPLKEIKKMTNSREHLPFYDWISDKEQFSGSPAFLSNTTSYFMTHIFPNQTIFPVKSPFDWRNQNSSVLNASELKALESILTKNMTLVRATPKVDKMKLGLAAVETLLENWSSWNSSNRPILLVSQNPEVLEEFFQHLQEIKGGKFSEGLTILGSQNKHKRIKTNQNQKREDRNHFHCRKQIDSLIKKIEALFKEFVTPIDSLGWSDNQEKTNQNMFCVDSINVIDLVYKNLLDLLEVPPQFENEQDRYLIFSHWWSNSIYPQLFYDVNCQELKRIGISDAKQQHIGQLFDKRQEEQEMYQQLHPGKFKVTLSDVLKLEKKNIEYHGYVDDYLGKWQKLGIQKTQQMEQEEVDFNSCFDGQEIQLNKTSLTSQCLITLPYEQFANIRASIFLKHQNKIKKKLMKMITEYDRAEQDFKEARWKSSLDEFKDSKVIGGTMSDINSLIDSIKRTEYEVIIVIDEAEQILENMLLPLASPSLKQLVLIGNYPQTIKPYVKATELKQETGYGESLFSRLIKMGMETFEIIQEQKEQEKIMNQQQQRQNEGINLERAKRNPFGMGLINPRPL